MFTNAVKDISVVGSSPIIFILMILVIVYFLIRHDHLRALIVTLSFGSAVYSTALKSVFEKSRPSNYVAHEIIPWNKVLVWENYSFPSTHTVLYTAFFGYLLYLTYKIKGVDRILRHVVRICSAVMILFVGTSRVLLGAHFVKDVVFGYLFGLVYLAVLITVERFLEQKQLRKPPLHK